MDTWLAEMVCAKALRQKGPWWGLRNMESICAADGEGESGKRAGRGRGLETKFFKSKN